MLNSLIYATVGAIAALIGGYLLIQAAIMLLPIVAVLWIVYLVINNA